MACMKTSDDDNRDPNSLHDNLKVEFDEVFGEPKGIRSCDCAWDCTRKIFECWKRCWYMTIQGLCCCCCGCGWATVFASVALFQIWCMVPYVRVTSICVGNIGTLLRIMTNNVCSPYFEACGGCLSQIKISKG
ncbi:hypothetical protein SNEBB_005422 [Seison nebaliae]|nr:hypothetical protein SNEBB_005422 [Seison nebaliae]